MRRAIHAAALLLLAAAPVAAQETFADIEYFSGHAGMTDKVKGVLVLSADSVRFQKKDGTHLLTMSTERITDVTLMTDIRDGSVGKKLLFGSLAGSRKQEFLQVTYETDETAEVLVFKVKQNTGANVAAKIRFAVKRKTGTVPDGGQSQSETSVPLD